MKEVDMIVAAGLDGSIGRGGDLIWRIPADLRRFKSLTMGHPVIMGRKTWESLPRRPLPGRLNIVITRDPDYRAGEAVTAHSPEEAIAAACRAADGVHDVPAPFVIGGAQIYEAFLPFVTRLYLTRVHAVCPDADAFIPPFYEGEEWRETEKCGTEVTPEGVAYDYVTYVRTGS